MRGSLILACILVNLGVSAVEQVRHEGLSLVQVKIEARRGNDPIHPFDFDLSDAAIGSWEASRGVCVAGPDQRTHKVFVHSLPKCATTSTGMALKQFGYRDCSYEPDQWFHHVDAIEAARKLVMDPDGFMDPTNISQPVQEQVRSMLADFKMEADRCDSFSDWPVGHAARAFPLALKYILWPEGRFIWIDRPFDSWYESLRKHEDAHPLIYKVHGRQTPKDQARVDYDGLKYEIDAFSKHFPGKVLWLNMEDVDWNPIKDFLFGDVCKSPDLPYPAKNVRSKEFVPDGQDHTLEMLHPQGYVVDGPEYQEDLAVHGYERFLKDGWDLSLDADNLGMFEQLKEVDETV